MTRRPELLLASRPCNQCLTSPSRIVSGERAADIVRDCRATGKHFICHKGSIAGLNVHCRGVHNCVGSQAFQLAQRLGIPVVEINPDEL